MKRTFKTNLNCGNCVAAVKPLLDKEASIERWKVDTGDPKKALTVEGDDVSVQTVERLVADAGFRVFEEIDDSASPTDEGQTQRGSQAEGRSFIETYRPLLLVLAYLIGLTVLFEIMAGSLDWMRAMGRFMGGFFLAFSFFKMLDLRGFADSYATYDLLARRWRTYGFAYPFIELGLGIAYLAAFAPALTNIVTLVVMLLGLAGVSQALFEKRRIQCACLGTVFNLPMSKVTFIEDAGMAAMAAAMLVGLAI